MRLLVKMYPITKLRKSVEVALQKKSVWNDFMNLKEQFIIIKHVIEICMVKDIKSWQMLGKRLPVNIHNFCCRYLIMSFANNSQLKRWKITNSELCSLCLGMQTQLHVFNHCSYALNMVAW